MATEAEMVAALNARQGPSKKLLLFGGLALPFLIAVSVALVLASGGKSNRAWSAFEKCMIGPPLAQGENVFLRIRRISQGLGVAEKNPWPSRCAGSAHALFQALDGDAKGELIRRLLSEQLNCNPTNCSFPETGQPLTKADELWKAASIAQLERVEVPDTIAAPEPSEVRVSEPFASLGSAKLLIAAHVFDKNGKLYVVLKRSRRQANLPNRVCEFSTGGRQVQCRDMKSWPTFRGRVKLVSGTPKPIVLGNSMGPDGLEQMAFPFGSPDPLPTRAGIVDGFALEQRQNGLFLLNVDKGRARSQKKLDIPANASVVGSWLTWFDTKSEDLQTMVQRIGKDGELLAKPRPLGGPFPARSTCQTTDAVVAYTRRPRRLSVWFEQGASWSAPAVADLPASRQRKSWPRVCAKNLFVTNSVVAKGKSFGLSSVVCRPTACKINETPWTGKEPTKFIALAQLAGSQAVVYETRLGDKRLRFGAPSKFSNAKETILFDSFEYAGPKFAKWTVLAGPNYFVVLFDDEKELHAFFVDEKGESGAVKVL